MQFLPHSLFILTMLLDPGSRCTSPHSINGVVLEGVVWLTSRIVSVQVRQMVLDCYRLVPRNIITVQPHRESIHTCPTNNNMPVIPNLWISPHCYVSSFSSLITCRCIGLLLLLYPPSSHMAVVPSTTAILSCYHMVCTIWI